MAAILDRCVPSRRLEKRRQRALQESLDSRFGDTHITAPTEGAWNQIGSDVDKGYLPSTIASGGWSPDLSLEGPTSPSTVSTEKVVEHDPHGKDSQKHNFTITIPLPWSSRKSHMRTASTANNAIMSSTRKEDQAELSPRSFMSSPEPTPRSFVSSPDPNSKSYLSSPNTTLQSQATSPVVIYKPVSEEYKQQLAEMASGISRVDSPPSLQPDRAQNTSPANFTYKPASEDFVREMAEIGMGPSPAIPQRETFPPLRGPSKPTSISSPSDPGQVLISYSPELRMAPMGLPPDPRPTPVNQSPEPRLPVGLPAQPRVGTTRSASRGPAAERVGTTRSASRGPATDRLGTTRSSSRGPAAERVGNTRSSSRGPPTDRLPTARSASRGPPLERSGNACIGRSSSRGPTSTRIPYRESASSDSSAGSGITSSSSPTLNNSFSSGTTNNVPTTITETDHNNGAGRGAGYYPAVAKGYKRRAGDVEESEHERRRRNAEMEKNGRMRREQDKAFHHGPQEMVPDEDELW
jgi:hypothetical protein